MKITQERILPQTVAWMVQWMNLINQSEAKFTSNTWFQNRSVNCRQSRRMQTSWSQNPKVPGPTQRKTGCPYESRWMERSKQSISLSRLKTCNEVLQQRQRTHKAFRYKIGGAWTREWARERMQTHFSISLPMDIELRNFETSFFWDILIKCCHEQNGKRCKNQIPCCDGPHVVHRLSEMNRERIWNILRHWNHCGFETKIGEMSEQHFWRSCKEWWYKHDDRTTAPKGQPDFTFQNKHEQEVVVSES